jgi:protein-arginine kinase
MCTLALHVVPKFVGQNVKYPSSFFVANVSCGVYDISNKRRLGLSEIDAIQEMRRGVEEIIKKEKSL